MALRANDWIPDRVCWPRVTCRECLDDSVNCIWCPFSGTCMLPPKNDEYPPLFAGIGNETVCPTIEERYEVRTKDFGCSVSAMTVMSVLFTAFIGLILIILVFIITAFYFKRQVYRVYSQTESHPTADASGPLLDAANLVAIFCPPTTTRMEANSSSANERTALLVGGDGVEGDLFTEAANRNAWWSRFLRTDSSRGAAPGEEEGGVIR